MQTKLFFCRDAKLEPAILKKMVHIFYKNIWLIAVIG